jgi:hypothetical protein
MAYSENFPAQRPIFSLDAANAGRLDPRMTFSRSDTPPTYAAPSAVHYWSNEKHLSSDNLLLQSSDFDTAWSKQGLATPTGGQSDPAGGTDGFTLVEDGNGGYHRIYQSMSQTGDLALTVYAKQTAGTRYLMLTLFNASNDYEAAVFDLAGGAAATSSGSSSSYTSVSTSQTSSGGSYYKCVLKATGTVTTVSVSLNDSASAGGVNSSGLDGYAGDGSSSINVAFASLSSVGSTEYVPTTTQIARAYAPTLKSVATAGQPRFEYDPSTDGQSAGTSRGILIEGQATNLYGRSLDMTGQSQARTNIDSNVAIGPTGQLTADAIRLDATNSDTHTREYVFTVAASTTYTFSVYLKAAGMTHAVIRPNNFFAESYVYFNLSNGTVEGSPTLANSMTAVGNGWYRCSVTATTTGSGAGSFNIYITDSGSSTIVGTGDSYRAILGQGIQIETGSHPSSFIETSGGTSATRASESLSVATADIGYTGGPFTIVSETAGGQGYYPRAFTLTNGNLSNRVVVYRDSSSASGSTNWLAYCESDGSFQGALTIPSSASAGKLAVSYNTNDVSVCASGGTVATDSSAVISDALTTLRIGTNYIGAEQLNGHCKRIAIYNEALSDSNLQAVTS